MGSDNIPRVDWVLVLDTGLEIGVANDEARTLRVGARLDLASITLEELLSALRSFEPPNRDTWRLVHHESGGSTLELGTAAASDSVNLSSVADARSDLTRIALMYRDTPPMDWGAE